MAASLPKSKVPSLVSKLEGHTDTINQAVPIPGEDAIISVADDKTMRVWVKRDSGQYWPTICQVYQAAASSLCYHHSSMKLFVGLANGTIHEYKLSRDLNRLDPKRTYLAHTGRVTGLHCVDEQDWLLSVSRDKSFHWYCTKTGRKLGSFEAQAWCLAVQYDPKNNYGFVSDYSGQINVLKLDTTGISFVTTLKGHQSSVRCLCYDSEKRILYSGGFDQIIVVWDIGSQQGTAFELTGHKSKIRALYFSHAHKLLSASEDRVLGLWDLDSERQETAEWGAGSACEKCGVPFFWNVKEMWTQKTVGVRQHHCRRCGRAVCATCSHNESTFPPMGFEIPVRMCEDCHADVSTDDRNPLASFVTLPFSISYMAMDEGRGLLVTTDTDKVIRVYDAKQMLTD